VKLEFFFAGDGDCLLLTSSDGHRALIDGGRSETFQKQTWPALQALAKADEAIDLLVVSHIDADHISGILWLMRAVAAWAVYDYQTTEGGNPGFPEPAIPRPPDIKRFWHNSWRAQLGDLAGPIQAFVSAVDDGLQTSSFDLAAVSDPGMKAIEAVEGLAESIPDGVDLLRIVDDETPLRRNAPFDDLVLLREPPHVEKLGKTKLTVLGPAKKHLERLQEEWREWLDTPAGRRAASEEAPAGDEELVASVVGAAEIIAETDASKVTPPNRASITLLAEEEGKTCLLTGDAAEEELIEGLEAAGRMVDGRCWCDVIKVQHHGSEYNVSQAFAGTVLGEQYVFCADGAHGNPDPSVVKTVVETRLAADERPFTVWFTCSPERSRPSRRDAMRAAIKEATKAARRHPRITVEVLDAAKPSVEIPV
jgi:hypothetical protein